MARACGVFMEKKYRYSLRFALDPATDTKQRVRALCDFCREAKIDDVMFFVAAEELNNGHVTKEQAAPYMREIEKAGKELAKIGVSVSLNPWITISHGDRGRPLQKGQDFDVMVDCNGRKAMHIVCPLSKNWRAYFTDLLRYYAESVCPETMWLEDDFRVNNHEPLADGGCFCNAHMRLYCRALGKEVSREEFVRGVTQDLPGYRAAYLKVNHDVMTDTLEYIVDSLNGVQDGFGLMTSSTAVYMAEGRDQKEMFSILSKRAPSLNRLSLGCYRQASSLGYSWYVNAGFMLGRFMLEDDQRVVGEIENFPMTLYSKSAHFTAFQTEMALPLCMEGQTLDIFEFNGNGIYDGKSFADELAVRKDYFQSFYELNCRFSSLQGVSVLVSECSPLHKKYGVEKISDLVPADTWFAGVLSGMGISFRYTKDCKEKGRAVAVGGEVLRCFTDEEIRSLFRDNFVLLSGTSLQVLAERGLKELAGVESFEVLPERSGVYSYEQCVMPQLARIPQERASCQYFTGDYVCVRFSENAVVHNYTAIYNYDHSCVGSGLCTINGKVFLIPYTEREYPFGLYSPIRERAIYAAVRAYGSTSCTVHTEAANVAPYLFAGENFDVMAVCNYSDDAYPFFKFQTPKEYRRAVYVSARQKKECEPERAGEYTLLDVPVPAMASFYLKLYY